jgi:prepilin-type N-terminal cleavage/methylation domain-containing protein
MLKNFQISDKKLINDQTAFTLAEVLITLLIIGAVASLTIPTIIADTEKAETATQVKKYQSVLSQAVMNIKNEYGSIINSPLNSNGDYINGWNTLKPYLNLAKDCGTATGQTCWANGIYKHLNNTDWVNFNNYFVLGRGVLADGSSIDYEARINCITNKSTTNKGPLYNSNCGTIYIDVNGHKPPNTAGRDVFAWHVLQNGTVYPIGTLDDVFLGCDPTSNDITPSSDGAPGFGYGCTAKVIKDGKIDY